MQRVRGEYNTQAIKKFSNPPIKLAVPADFPMPIDALDTRKVLYVIKKGLAKHGLTLKDIHRINIAYPQKDPDLFPGHHNEALRVAQKLRIDLFKLWPTTQWRLAKEIYELVHLNRSLRTGLFHALVDQQEYVVKTHSQYTPAPFLKADNPIKDFFIIVDWHISKGTTMTNMMSYIHHNGGVVLGAVAESGYWEALNQTDRNTSERFNDVKNRFSLRAPFNDEAKNNKRLKQIAFNFFESTRHAAEPIDPATCIEYFERALNACGNSVFALTESEACDLASTYYSFLPLMSDLKKVSSLRNKGRKL